VTYILVVKKDRIIMVSKKVLLGIAAVVIVCIIVVAVVFQAGLLNPAAGPETTSPDFELSAIPASLSIPKGGSANVTIKIRSINGFNSPVSFSGVASPADMAIEIDFTYPSPVTPPANGEVNATRTFDVYNGCPTGSCVFTLTGQSSQPSLSHMISITVTVTGS
jgi:hypothetical protein